MPFNLFCAGLVALPWLWPFTSGPVAATLPYLAGMAVADGLAGFACIAAELLQATFGAGADTQNPPGPHPA